MFYYLLFLFTVVPLFELYLLVRVGQYVGAFNTVAIVIFTGIFGAFLAKMEGLRVLYSVQKDLQEGRMPTSQILDGLLILIGAVLLITPGLLTDVVGFILVIPSTRALLKVWLKKQLQKIIDKREGVITVDGYRDNEDDF
ncbi:MAG: membrane protein FxsA [Candidatus Omnitrophica bacterium]|nr:membrane protein FxsA [Candidatus Omnitrophota bacterium]